MTRKLLAIGILAAVACLAQGRGGARGGGGMRGGGGHGGGHGVARGVFSPVRPSLGPIGHGFGNVVFPATGIPNALYPYPTTFPQRLSATVSGYPGYAVGSNFRHQRRNLVGGFFPVPVVVGGYGYDPAYAAAPAPNITIVNAPPAQPSVIINQDYQPQTARPVMRDYTNEPLPESGGAGVQSYQAPVPSHPEGRRGQIRSVDEDKPTIYLLALQDGTVKSALAYWVEGDTVHYVTTRYVKATAPVKAIDIAVSEQLNAERGVDFHIPGRN